jgi:hypothetical protein
VRQGAGEGHRRALGARGGAPPRTRVGVGVARRGREGEGKRERERERGAHLGVQIWRSPSPKPRAPWGERGGGEEVAARKNQMRERERREGGAQGRHGR